MSNENIEIKVDLSSILKKKLIDNNWKELY